MATSTHPAHDAVMERLDRVDDPELDRSIVELEYISDLTIDGAAVTVEFTLPTAWCSPAFAWMMATGAREEIEDLPGVTECTVQITDHMHAEGINRGVNEELKFEDVFPDAEDGIEAVRRTLDEKARMARQFRAVEALRQAGVTPAQIVELRREEVSLEDERTFLTLADGGLMISVSTEPIAEYLEKATTVGIVTDSADRLFATPEGDPISVDEFEDVHRRARLAKTNVAGQGSVCAGLNEVRNGVVPEP
ncbi:MAG TPA: iron-sulfur cluster assembly protein [Halococcus sp.]|nr:iron-sulfur cluster assembly protein [Halococcus sp.]